MGESREDKARRIAKEQKWDIRKKPKFNKWFIVMIVGFVAYLIITYVVRG